jgi:hypothetical protein
LISDNENKKFDIRSFSDLILIAGKEKDVELKFLQKMNTTGNMVYGIKILKKGVM